MDGSNPPRIDHADFLGELSDGFHARVRKALFEFLRHDDEDRRARARRRVLEPLAYTLERRRNFFRTGFSLAVGDFVGQPAVGEVTALSGEMAWTCALLADDMLDGADEREGHPSAHRLYGKVRTLKAVWFGLWNAWRALILLPPLPLAARLRLGGYATLLLWRCLFSQLPLPKPRSLTRFRRFARNVNNSTHWSLVAPAMACGDSRLVKLLRRYADAISVNGKMRNDLLDYCGGSTENETVHSDFAARQATFPIIVLWQAELAGSDRRRLRRHFFAGRRASDLSIDELTALFRRHGTLESCLELMGAQAAAARAAIEGIERVARIPPPVPEVLRHWVRHQMDLAEERVSAWRRSA